MEEKIRARISELRVGRQEVAAQLLAFDAAIGELEALLRTAHEQEQSPPVTGESSR